MRTGAGLQPANPLPRAILAARGVVEGVGIPRLIIALFIAGIFIVAWAQDLPIGMLLTSSLVRFGMNGVLVLAMVPSILGGEGLNFGLPVGVICGLLGALLSVQFCMRGASGFLFALLFAIPLAALAGWAYGILLNRVKGEEMMIGTYVGFSVVAVMCVVWIVAPFSNPEIIWVVGGEGVRMTVTIGEYWAQLLNNFLKFTVLGVEIPTGLLLFLAGCCLLVRWFFRTKLGLAVIAAGSNPQFARSAGINVDQMRIVAAILSTVLGAVGLIVYAQSYGFLQMYTAPLMMAFPAVAGILIGGASATKASITNVIVGTLLFQTLLATALPVTRTVVSGPLSEIVNIIISQGVILYALTRGGGRL
ncbi:MAG: ABC transporter permease subunit [Chloroflexota bacterium]